MLPAVLFVQRVTRFFCASKVAVVVKPFFGSRCRLLCPLFNSRRLLSVDELRVRPGRPGTALVLYQCTTVPGILYEQTVLYQKKLVRTKKIPGTRAISALSTAFGPFATPQRGDGAGKRTHRAWKTRRTRPFSIKTPTLELVFE